MEGCVHIYCGDGKGKTTASVGLAVRAAGAGKAVLFTQFLKPGTSSEIGVLKAIPGVTVLCDQTPFGFYRNMTPAQRIQAASAYAKLLETALSQAKDCGVLILDEVIPACRHGLVDGEVLLDFLTHRPAALEVVLTGRNPSPELLALADYVTEMRKCRHPFDRGIPARLGVEF